MERVCGRIGVGPVGEHPLVGADGEQGGVKVPGESPFTQCQLLHLRGNFLVSLLKSNRRDLVDTKPKRPGESNHALH